jgi:hypothetical protein
VATLNRSSAAALTLLSLRGFWDRGTTHTQYLTHARTYTRKNLHTQELTHPIPYTRKNLHTQELTHARTYTRKNLHKNLHKQELTHARTYTRKNFHTQELTLAALGLPPKQQDMSGLATLHGSRPRGKAEAICDLCSHTTLKPNPNILIAAPMAGETM